MTAPDTTPLTTTDNTTGLTWENLTEDDGINCVRHRYTWDNATAVKIAALNEANFAGHDDWRLPTLDELLSLVDHGRHNPACRPEFLPTRSNFYWSSSTDQLDLGDAWVVFFLLGLKYAGYKTTGFHVRAVRAVETAR